MVRSGYLDNSEYLLETLSIGPNVLVTFTAPVGCLKKKSQATLQIAIFRMMQLA